MSGKRFENKNKKQNKKIIIYVILIILIAIMIFSGIKIYTWFSENKKNNEILKEIKGMITVDNNIENVEKYNVDFMSLKQKNGEVIAWIKVNGTDIEYPVVKTTDNDYYMTHSFDDSYNSAGWVFMDYRNKFDGSDDNMVIYAHNRRDGSMFCSLKNILEKEWQENEENYIIPFITENEKSEFKVFSVYQVEEEDYYITTNFKTKNEFSKFIQTIQSRSLKDFNVEVTDNDQILTLSTCANNNKYRVVLHAVKIKK